MIVWFYSISTIVCYIIRNPVYTYILDLHDLSKYCYVSLTIQSKSVSVSLFNVGYLMPKPFSEKNSRGTI